MKKILRVCSYYLVLFVIGVLLEGFVLMNLWQWFIVRLGVPAIGFFHAVGVALLCGFIAYQFYDFKKNEEVNLVEPVMYLFVRPLLTLIIGFLVYLLL